MTSSTGNFATVADDQIFAIRRSIGGRWKCQVLERHSKGVAADVNFGHAYTTPEAVRE
ncbi:hypothetical protein ACO0K2_16960 [Undibacterium sp. MH2W]|uniref:hypothetical protein n=1 Tax=Undibacterium sp. MH2W TaxID=3413044 RepID=UPI003BF2756E